MILARGTATLAAKLAQFGARLWQALLFSSNSLPIRHLEIYCPGEQPAAIHSSLHSLGGAKLMHTDCAATGVPTILCNRGASGIDGIVHTALGAAIGNAGKPQPIGRTLQSVHG